MFVHRKELIRPIKVDEPDATFGKFLLEQFGGAIGELRAALQYWVQSLRVINDQVCRDDGTKQTPQHLLTREITHARMFMKALDQMGKLDDPMFGSVPPDETVNLVFNISQGQDARGPWNEPPSEYIGHPKPDGELLPAPVNPDDERGSFAAGGGRSRSR